MARPKKQVRAKEPVRLRSKLLSNGNKSLYLDIYREGKRQYEFLKLYLVPERDAVTKTQNESVLAAANAIKSQRIIEISGSAAGINVDKRRSKITLGEWGKIYLEKVAPTLGKSTILTYKFALIHLHGYGDSIPLYAIDKQYCQGFLEYITKSTCKRNNAILNDNTVKVIARKINAIINAAVREGLLLNNPFHSVDHSYIPKGQESQRCFLSIEEVKVLEQTPTPYEAVKRAFLFSCFSGLRYSDIQNLTWNDLEVNNGTTYANIVIIKTKRTLYLPLNKQALSFLPEYQQGTNKGDRIFNLPDNKLVNVHLRQWCQSAGITKRVTFHVARHTFATISLTLGADLYAVSKLLGHTNVQTTQIYAKIINEKKVETVSLFDKAF
jgi:site-specific recombinase XerD